MTTKTIFVVPFMAFVLGLCGFIIGPRLAGSDAQAQQPEPAGAAVVTVYHGQDLSTAGQQAVAELARVLSVSLGGREVSVVDKRPSSGTVVWVGRPVGLAEAFPGIDLSTPGEEQVRIVVRGNQIAVLGNDQVSGGVVIQDGTTLAIYTFMQRNLGVRWFWPGELGEEIPVRSELALKDEVFTYTPQVHGRTLRLFQAVRMLPKTISRTDPAYIKALAYDTPIAQWAARNRLGGSFKMAAGHAFVTWYGQYVGQHPDYFALQPDGSRAAFPAPKTAKMCVSNPAVVAQMIENARPSLAGRSGPRMISGSENDSGYSGYCTCPACVAWDDQSAPKLMLKWKDKEEMWPSLTDRYSKFWNRIAVEANKAFPGEPVTVGAWAYGAMRTPPVSTNLDPAVIIGFVGNLSWGDETRRSADLALWDGWSKKVSRMVWRPNLFHYGWAMPGSMVMGLSEDFKFMASRGLVGIDIDSIFNDWATRGLDYYALAQLAWDPGLDPQTLINDYSRRAFGPAAAPKIVEYFKELEKVHADLAKARSSVDRYGMVEVDRAYFTAEKLAALEAIIAQARQAAKNDPGTHDRQRERLVFLLEGLSFAKAQARVMEAMTSVRQGTGDAGQNLRDADKLIKQRDVLGARLSEKYAIGFLQFSNQSSVRKMSKYFGPIDPDDLERLADKTVTPLPTRWAFSTDPQKQGLKLGWSAAGVDTRKWHMLSINAVWGHQLKPQGPVDLDNPVDESYVGDGWYRTTFPRPELSAGERLLVEFPAIDKSCVVYVNAKEIGQQCYDPKVDPDAWNKPRRFDITDALKPGENLLVVMVNSEFGHGGIFGGAYLRKVKSNLVPQAQLASDTADGVAALWRVQFTEDQAGTTQAVPGMYVSEKALRVNLSKGTAGGMSGANILLPAGAYTLAMSGRVKVETEKDKALALRVAFVSENAADKSDEPLRSWVKFSGNGKWERATTRVVLDKPMRLGSLRIFMNQAGVYDLQDIELRAE